MLSGTNGDYEIIMKVKGNLFQNQKKRGGLKDDSAALPELLTAGRMEEAVAYLKSEEAGTETVQGQFCANIYLNAVFAYYFRKLKELEIALKLDIQIGEEELPYKELCQIISNGLENACNASRIQAQGEVSVRMKCNKDCLILRIKNRCSDNLPAKKGAASKARGAGRGEELRAVREVVEKLDGVMLCYTETDNFVLDVMVRINNKK